MPAEFEQGFFVRDPAWHKQGVVLADYPTREEAQRLAGHDFDIVESPIWDRITTGVDNFASYAEIDGWKKHTRSDTGGLLHVSRGTYEPIPNSVAYDFAEVMLDQGFEYDAGVTLKGGALCALTLKLDEPFYIQNDPSKILPYLGLSWAHDGTSSLRGRPTTVRQVCANTVAASEAEGKRLGVEFTIRHTKNWRDYVKEAQEIAKGARHARTAYMEVAEELAAIEFTPEQRDLFVSTIIGDKADERPLRTERVQKNLDGERAKINALFAGATIPEAHRFTGYGAWLAGGEYFDHVRAFRSTDSYVKRTLLADNPAKRDLAETVRLIAR